MKKINIGIDISQLAFRGGVVTYTDELTQRLEKFNDLSMKFFYSSLRRPYKGQLEGVKHFPIPITLAEIIFNQWRFLKIEKFIGEIDIFHSSDWIQPPTDAKKITTYHDVIPIKFPEWSESRIVQVHKRRLKIVEREIDKVIAVSESTKQDLLDVSNLDSRQIEVIYEAADPMFCKLPEQEVEEFRNRKKLPAKFVLAIGGIGQRRNLTRIKQSTANYPLIISGETLPYLPKHEMVLLYNCATVLLYPSLYEGFGLPILEALNCGLPVVTSNISSMPEVGGKAALYVNPTDTEDIRKKLKIAYEDKELRKELISAGVEQVQRFSWEKAADETALVYKELYKQSKTEQ